MTTKVILCKNSKRYKDKFSNWFHSINWENIPNNIRKDQIIYFMYGEYGFHYILNDNILNFLTEHNSDYSVNFIAEETNQFDQPIKLTAWINLPDEETAFYFKLKFC